MTTLAITTDDMRQLFAEPGQAEDAIVSLFGAVTEVGERVTELARQHQTLNVRASEMRHNLSGMQREFDTTSNDVCRILEHLIDADHRAERIEADLAEVKTLLTKLAGQAG